jgi:hypothetical protein
MQAFNRVRSLVAWWRALRTMNQILDPAPWDGRSIVQTMNAFRIWATSRLRGRWKAPAAGWHPRST